MLIAAATVWVLYYFDPIRDAHYVKQATMTERAQCENIAAALNRDAKAQKLPPIEYTCLEELANDGE